MTLKELKSIEDSLASLFTAKLPVKTMWKLRTFIKKCKEAFTELEDARIDLLKKYAEKDQDGNPIQIVDIDNSGKRVTRFQLLPSNQIKMDEEWRNLLEEVVELPEVNVKLEDLEPANLSVVDISNLSFLIEA